MTIVVLAYFSDISPDVSTYLTLVMIIFLITGIFIQYLRIYYSSIPNKSAFLFKAHVGFVPNYIMVCLAMFLQILSFLPLQVSTFRIVLQTLMLILQLSYYIFFCQKEFMNTRTFVICIVTLAIWVISITLTSVRTNVSTQ